MSNFTTCEACQYCCINNLYCGSYEECKNSSTRSNTGMILLFVCIGMLIVGGMILCCVFLKCHKKTNIKKALRKYTKKQLKFYSPNEDKAPGIAIGQVFHRMQVADISSNPAGEGMDCEDNDCSNYPAEIIAFPMDEVKKSPVQSFFSKTNTGDKGEIHSTADNTPNLDGSNRFSSLMDSSKIMLILIPEPEIKQDPKRAFSDSYLADCVQISILDEEERVEEKNFELGQSPSYLKTQE